MRSVLTSNSFYRFASSCFLRLLHFAAAVKTSVSIPVRASMVALLVVNHQFGIGRGLSLFTWVCAFRLLCSLLHFGLILSVTSVTDGRTHGQEFLAKWQIMTGKPCFATLTNQLLNKLLKLERSLDKRYFFVAAQLQLLADSSMWND